MCSSLKQGVNVIKLRALGPAAIRATTAAVADAAAAVARPLSPRRRRSHELWVCLLQRTHL
jgi:hypothetical protein